MSNQYIPPIDPKADKQILAVVDAAANERNTRLDLGHWDFAHVGPAQVAELAKRAPLLGHVEELVLSLPFFEEEAPHALCEVFKRMRQLRIVTLKVDCEQMDAMRPVATGLGHLRVLERLTMDRCGITTLGAITLSESIHGLNRLAELSLRDNDIEAEGVAAILDGFASHPTLRVFDLSGNSLRLAGAEAVVERRESLRALERLGLCKVGFRDSAVRVLSGAADSLAALTALDLSTNAITDAGLEPLLEVLLKEPWRSSLKSLNLAGSMIKQPWRELLGSDDADGWREYARRRHRGRKIEKEKTDRTLSIDAETLLEALLRLRVVARSHRSPKDEWCSKAEWFESAQTDRHRSDGDAIIADLVRRGAVEVRRTPSGKQARYRATQAADGLLQGKRTG